MYAVGYVPQPITTQHAVCRLHTLTSAKCIQRQREQQRMPNDMYTQRHTILLLTVH